MAEPRRRFRNKKRDDISSGLLAPVTIARREDARMVQPKILMKKDRDRDKEWDRDRELEREKEADASPSGGSCYPDAPAAIKTIIIPRLLLGNAAEQGALGGPGRLGHAV